MSFDEQYPEAAVIMGVVLRVRVWRAGLTAGIKAPGGVPKLQEPCCDPRYWVWATPSGTPLFITPLKASVFNHLENKYKVSRIATESKQTLLRKWLGIADAHDLLRDKPGRLSRGRGRMSDIARMLFQATQPPKSHATTRRGFSISLCESIFLVSIRHLNVI